MSVSNRNTKITLLEKFAPTDLEQNSADCAEFFKDKPAHKFKFNDYTFDVNGTTYNTIIVYRTHYSRGDVEEGEPCETYYHMPTAYLIQKARADGKGEGVYFQILSATGREFDLLNFGRQINAAILRADTVINSEKYGGWPHRAGKGYWSDRSAEMLGSYGDVITALITKVAEAHRPKKETHYRMRTPGGPGGHIYLLHEDLGRRHVTNTLEALDKQPSRFIRAAHNAAAGPAR